MSTYCALRIKYALSAFLKKRKTTVHLFRLTNARIKNKNQIYRYSQGYLLNQSRGGKK